MGEGVFPALSFILTLRPSKDEDVPRTIRQRARVWVPAFAGNAEEGKQGPLRPFGPLSPEAEVPAKPG